MPDITMCRDRDCARRLACYRYTAQSDGEWQSFFTASPRTGNDCTFFWPDETKDDGKKP